MVPVKGSIPPQKDEERTVRVDDSFPDPHFCHFTPPPQVSLALCFTNQKEWGPHLRWLEKVLSPGPGEEPRPTHGRHGETGGEASRGKGAHS